MKHKSLMKINLILLWKQNTGRDFPTVIFLEEKGLQKTDKESLRLKLQSYTSHLRKGKYVVYNLY